MRILLLPLARGDSILGDINVYILGTDRNGCRVGLKTQEA